MDILTILLLSLGGFFAAFIDSTVGGGGLISVPALLSLGLPVNFALGTNKLAASMGSFMSVVSFWRAGKINKKTAGGLFPFSFFGSALGAFAVYMLPEQLMKYIIVILLSVIAIYTFIRKDFGAKSAVKKTGFFALTVSIIMAWFLGFYDGFFGPGTGSFLIFGFLFLGYDFVSAAGNAKVLNFASGIGALISFAISHSILWSYGLIMGAAMIAGAYVGSQYAIKKGVSYIRPLFLIITSLLILKQIISIIY
ncbi:MAG: TSUP family transporter [Elusimicrobiota bacterium]|jgi:uncharacterized membrane protein YfcA|nr:TSUP family transporter [Elusimicrobiota bacterium]